MTGIITITSGSTQVGKTQLAINLALELVRRGRQTGVFQDAAAARALDGLLELHHCIVPHRRITDQPAGDVVRRGYQGVDFLSCRLRLEDWAQSDAERLNACIHDMDTHDGYDELLIDTSGMEPRALLGCCLAAASLIVVLTPDAQSQAEAFALLRILGLNGFDGGLYLLVNRLQEAQQAAAIRDRFNTQLMEHLGLEITLLGGLPEDVHVSAAQRARQAFTSVYPDSEVAAAMVGIAAVIDTGGGATAAARQTVTRFWKTFLEKLRTPLQLPGQQLLADAPEQDGGGMRQERGEATPAGTGLIQFDGSLAMLCDTLGTLPQTLGVLAQDMAGLVAALTGSQGVHAMTPGAVCDEQECLRLAAAILNGVCGSAAPGEHVHLQVTECRLHTDTDNWLRSGNYMRFAFRVGAQDRLMERLQAVFARLHLPLQAQVPGSEVVWEQLGPAGTVSLGVSVSPPDELHLVLWMPARQGAGDAAPARTPAARRNS